MAVARGYVDVASEELQGDTFLLPLGFVAVTIYAVFMLGHLTCVENRVNKNFSSDEFFYFETLVHTSLHSPIFCTHFSG